MVSAMRNAAGAAELPPPTGGGQRDSQKASPCTEEGWG